MGKNIFVSILLLVLCSGKQFAQTKELTFDNYKEPKSLEAGGSIFGGIGAVGCEWGGGFGVGAAGRLHVGILEAGLYTSYRDWMGELSPHNSFSVVRTSCQGATIGIGRFRKHFSASIGVGAGKYATTHYYTVDSTDSFGYHDTKWQDASGYAFCMAGRLSFHGRNAGFTIQYTGYYAGKVSNYALLFGLELGLMTRRE